jgi:hypothetical protein
MVKYDFRCYGCKSKMVKMVNDKKERYICCWCTKWGTIEAPSIQESLNCGEYGPGGYECALCWTTGHMMLVEEEPTTVIHHGMLNCACRGAGYGRNYLGKDSRQERARQPTNSTWYLFIIVSIRYKKLLWSYLPIKFP